MIQVPCNGMASDQEEKTDNEVFGNTWIYCSAHRRVHGTGWCTISVSNKLGLGIENNGEESLKEAAVKAKLFGLPLI